MSLIKKSVAAQAAFARKREVVYLTMLSFANARPAMVNGEPKERILVQFMTEDAELVQYYMFKESVYGLPNFVPKGGLQAQLTLQEDTSEDGKEYINAVALGIMELSAQKAA